jgi:hypothetical protein
MERVPDDRVAARSDGISDGIWTRDVMLCYDTTRYVMSHEALSGGPRHVDYTDALKGIALLGALIVHAALFAGSFPASRPRDGSSVMREQKTFGLPVLPQTAAKGGCIHLTYQQTVRQTCLAAHE